MRRQSLAIETGGGGFDLPIDEGGVKLLFHVFVLTKQKIFHVSVHTK
jgi:hypothetical protein